MRLSGLLNKPVFLTVNLKPRSCRGGGGLTQIGVVAHTFIIKNLRPDIDAAKITIPLEKNRYLDEMSKKSVIMGLPVVPFNQNKHSDVCQYLEYLENFLLEVFTPANKPPLPCDGGGTVASWLACSTLE